MKRWGTGLVWFGMGERDSGERMGCWFGLGWESMRNKQQDDKVLNEAVKAHVIDLLKLSLLTGGLFKTHTH